MVKLFVPTEHEKYYQKLLASLDIRHDLEIQSVKSGYVAIDKNLLTCGVMDASGELLENSVYKLNGAPHRKMPRKKSLQNAKYVDCDVVYCDGGRFFLFGHTLLEGFARIYPYLQPQYKNCKFVFAHVDKNPLPNYARRMLNIFGISDDQIIILNKSTRFRTVYVPDAAFDLVVHSSIEWAQTFRQIANNVPDCDVYDKIYLSRTAAGMRKTFGEEQIETVFEQNGYKIIHPEQLPIDVQIGLVKNCKYLAGLAGSALHLSCFMQPGGTVIQLKRNRQLNDFSYTQRLIDAGAGLDTVIVWASIEPIETGHWTSHPQLVGITPELGRFFDEMKFKYDVAQLADVGRLGRMEYDNAMVKYKRDKKIIKIKTRIARMLSCLLPGRYYRQMVRNFILEKLGVAK